MVNVTVLLKLKKSLGGDWIYDPKAPPGWRDNTGRLVTRDENGHYFLFDAKAGTERHLVVYKDRVEFSDQKRAGASLDKEVSP